MSKLIRYTFSLIVLLAAACSKNENQPSAEVTEAPVTISMLSGTASDTNQLNTSETDVKSVRIYIFDGNRLDRMQYFDIPKGGIKLDMRAKVGTGKTFCAVVNELPGLKTELDHVETPSGLNAVMYSLADYVNLDRNIGPTTGSDASDAYHLPFYGQIDNVTITEEGASLTLKIGRAVARIDLYLRAEERASFDCFVTPEATLKVERSADKGYFSPVSPNATPGVGRTFTLGTTIRLDKATGSGKSNYQRIYSFYVPAQQFAQDEDRMQLTLADLTWGEDGTKWTYDPFPFGTGLPSYNDRIQPNMVYQLYCTLSQAAFPVNVSVVVQDWDVKEQIEGL